MESFEQFLTETSSSDVECVEALVSHLKDLARRFNRQTVLSVWSKATSAKGDELIREILKNPAKSSSDLRKLVNAK